VTRRARPEFSATCGHCWGPLMTVDTRTLLGKRWHGTVYVHARHADWAGDPHPANPLVVEEARQAG
jgi:hypothetical protein